MNVTGYLGRNNLRGWGCLNPRLAYQEHKLMEEHRKRECACAVCGTKNDLQTHHNRALWSDESQAGTDPLGRFTTLCRACHLRWAHDFDFGHKYVENVSMVAACMREVQRSEKIVRRE